MANITIYGWIAEGGARVIQGKKDKILVFDVVENTIECAGITDDEFNTNNAWFHCSFQISLNNSKEIMIMPKGYTLRDANKKGYVTINKIGDCCSIIPGTQSMTAEQIVEYIVEGKWISVSGMEIITKGEDGNILRQVMVSSISFDDFMEVKSTKVLKVPYKSKEHLEYNSDPQ